MKPACLSACLLLCVSACTHAPQRPPAFGPPDSRPLPFVKSGRVLPERLAPALQSSRSSLDASLLPFSQVRLDAADPQVQHYEVQLVVVPAAEGRAEGLAAVWMSGRAQADGSTLTRLVASFSADGGRSFLPLQTVFGGNPVAVQFDPTLSFDSRSQRLLIGVMEQEGVDDRERRLWLARSQPGAPQSMLPGEEIVGPQRVYMDKGWLASGTDPSGGAVIYLTDVAGVRSSRDAGQSWSGPRQLDSATNLIQPLVLSDGRLFISYFGFGPQGLQTGFVHGHDENTLSEPRAAHDFLGSFQELVSTGVPGGFRIAPTAVVAESAVDGRLYMVLSDVTRRRAEPAPEVDLDLVLLSSADGGRSWGARRNLSDGLQPWDDQFMPWLQVDRQGHLHLAYFETASDPLGDGRASAEVHVWYARSEDAGASWVRTRLTSQPIPSERTRWSPLGNAADAQFLGDYIGLTTGTDAAFVAHPVFDGVGLGMAVSRIPLSASSMPLPSNPLALAGLWYEPATSGQGLQIDWLEGDVLALVFFGHRDSGANMFLTGAIGQRPQFGETLRIPLLRVSGGRFNGLNPALIERSSWGELELRFDSCTSARAVLRGQDGEQTLQLLRLGRPPGVACP